ncbi:MAG: hypothetical protein FWD57_11240 [Polyangiaceae bacterium]|nr:hypothetical protein [Polyangiaceae bacterium]
MVRTRNKLTPLATALVIGVVLIGGCKNDDPHPRRSKRHAESNQVDPDPGVPPVVTLPPPAELTTYAPPTPPPEPPPPPPTQQHDTSRSPVPAPSEYDARGEVTVRHSSSLRCETKKVREWLRVRCPYTVTGGGGGEVRVVRSTHTGEIRTKSYSSPMEAIIPVLPGSSHNLTFMGDWGRRTLRVDWPVSAAQALMYFDQPATAQSCRVPSDCPTNVCCFNPVAKEGFCATECDVGNTTFTCRTDADCPVVFGRKTRCLPIVGYKICQ